MIKYYPLSRVLTGSFTRGGEFVVKGIAADVVKGTPTSYTGPYYKTYDGKAYTGNDPVTGDNLELEPIQTTTDIQNGDTDSAFTANSGLLQTQLGSIDLANEYNQIKKVNAYDLPIFKAIQPIYLTPTPEDYEQGYIMRYFAKPRNVNGSVVECSQEVYTSLKSFDSPYNYAVYHSISLYWQLVGPSHDRVDPKTGILTRGVYDSNQRLVVNASKTFKGLQEYIGDQYEKYAKIVA